MLFLLSRISKIIGNNINKNRRAILNKYNKSVSGITDPDKNN